MRFNKQALAAKLSEMYAIEQADYRDLAGRDYNPETGYSQIAIEATIREVAAYGALQAIEAIADDFDIELSEGAK